jgi:hypothetical protein
MSRSGWMLALAVVAVAAVREQSTYIGHELPRCTAGQTVIYDSSGRPGCGAAAAALPSGATVLVAATACPAGLIEDDSFAGRFPQGTTAAAGDVGTTGGSSSYTPAGTVSQPTLTMNPYTPSGTVSAVSVSATGTKMSTASNGTAALTALAGTTIAAGTGNTITLPAPTFTGQQATLTGTISQPSFTGQTATLTGTVSQPVFTGTPATLVPPYRRVLFCRAP